MIFSSPETKARDELMYRLSVHSNILNTALEPWANSPQTSCGAFSQRGLKFCHGHGPLRWPSCLYMVKILKNLLQNLESFKAESGCMALGIQGLFK